MDGYSLSDLLPLAPSPNPRTESPELKLDGRAPHEQVQAAAAGANLWGSQLKGTISKLTLLQPQTSPDQLQEPEVYKAQTERAGLAAVPGELT